MSEKWIRWEPDSQIPISSKYQIHAVIDDYDSLKVFLAEPHSGGSAVELIFHGTVFAHRCAKEMGYLKTLQTVQGFDKWTFFLVRDSKFVDSIVVEAQGVYSTEYILHLAIIGGDDILEVLTDKLPEITPWNKYEFIPCY